MRVLWMASLEFKISLITRGKKKGPISEELYGQVQQTANRAAIISCTNTG